jgi:hypothetical protein
MNFPFEMKPDSAAMANRRAAQRAESLFSAFEKGFESLTARFVFIRHAFPPALRSGGAGSETRSRRASE